MGRAVLGLDGGTPKLDAAPRDLRDTALIVALQEGGSSAFDAAEKQFRGSQDAVLRSELLSAMGATHVPALDARARALVFEPALLRRNEIFPVVGGQLADAATRPALRDWVDTHFVELEGRLAPAGAALVSLYSAGMCTDADADAVQAKWGPRMEKVEGGPREVEQTVEAIRLCAAQVKARSGMPLDFAKR
jgi:alanyl aminopeptidase